MRLSTRFSLAIFSTCTLAFLCCTNAAEPSSMAMPTRGICAHRGDSDTHPENTIPAIREAIRLGAQMIEFDVALSKDGQLVLMHDDTIDRTTNGTGPVGNSTLVELKKMDAGSWKGSQFKNTLIPTLDEALSIMPENIWLNVHLKGGVTLAEKTTDRIAAHQRLHQDFLAFYLDLGAGILAEQHFVADIDVGGQTLAIVLTLAVAHGQHFTRHGFFSR